MLVCKKLSEVQSALNCSAYEVNNAWESYLGAAYMFVNGREVNKAHKGDDLLFVIVDETQEDYRNYFLEYQKEEYIWTVFADGKWQYCEIIDVVYNPDLYINHVTAKLEDGSIITREIEYAADEDDLREDGTIFHLEK